VTTVTTARSLTDSRREALRRALCPTEPVLVIAGHTEPGVPIPPPGPDATDEDVEAYITGLCRANPNM
jgi:hypothetical protein